MWLGVHGCVYDVTDFLPIHPGGTLIVAASAGLDCSVTFDEVCAAMHLVGFLLVDSLNRSVIPPILRS
jgi:cytochrome b involved in lipid metabolism